MLVKTDEDYKELSGFCNNNFSCFHCGEIVTPPLIVWNGNTAFIQFHLNCAVAFHLLFAHDLYEFKQVTGKVLIFDASPEESRKALQAYLREQERDHNRFPIRNVQLTVPSFHFIDGGSEKVHIQEENWHITRCRHHFKQARIIQEREWDEDYVCRHCLWQGGIDTRLTGKYRRWDDSSEDWIIEDE